MRIRRKFKICHSGEMMEMKGFTLLEIMVAVAIIMIISVAGLSGFIFSQQKSRDAKRKSDLAQVAKALELFNEDFGRYPIGNGGSIEGCQTAVGSSFTVCNWGQAFEAYPGGSSGEYQLYMSKLPLDPKGSQNYYYESDGTSMSLYSVLENDKDANYRTDLTEDCGGGPSSCNYKLSQYGAEAQ